MFTHIFDKEWLLENCVYPNQLLITGNPKGEYADMHHNTDFTLQYIYYDSDSQSWFAVDDWGGDVQFNIEGLFKFIGDIFESIYTLELINFDKKQKEKEELIENIKFEAMKSVLDDVMSYGVDSFYEKCSKCGEKTLVGANRGCIVEGCSRKKCEKIYKRSLKSSF